MFKRAILLGAAIAGRSTSSLFYTLLYREIFRKVYEYSDNNGPQTVKQMYNIGLAAANESAVRQEKVFKLFPASPEKLLEFIELLWQLVFGMPMEDFTTEKDYSDSLQPKLIYHIKRNPLIFGMDGSDPLDKFSWIKLTDGKRGYAAGITGMMMAATTNILRLKGNEKRIVIYDSKDILRGDPYLELACQIVDEIPPEDSPDLGKQSESQSESQSTAENQSGFLSNIDISSFEELLKDPKQFISDNLATVIRKYLKMEPFEFFDHFANYEEDVYRIFGYLLIHALNEKFRLIESFLKTEEAKKFVGYLVQEYYNNFFHYFPDGVIEDYRLNFIALLDTRLAPPHMVENFRKINKQRMIDLFFEGLIKALSNLGVDFSILKDDIWQEILENAKSKESGANNEQEKKNIENQIETVKEIYSTIALFAMVITQSRIGFNHAFISATGELISQSQLNNEKSLDKLKESIEKLSENLKNLNLNFGKKEQQNTNQNNDKSA